MHRLGFGVNERSEILRTVRSRNLNVCGIYTHLCAADSLLEDDVKFTRRQTEVFLNYWVAEGAGGDDPRHTYPEQLWSSQLSGT